MKVLFIFPHPDDESFGPSLVISKLKREGHKIFLLTLTKGGATKERFKFNYTMEQMGEVRYNEMLEVAKVLDLNGMTVLDLPDSGLKEMDPRVIEKVIKEHIELIKPDIVVTYAVHGISGFFDHLVTHAVVKHVYVELKSNNAEYLKRLAFFTLSEDQAKKGSTLFQLKFSLPQDLDCAIKVNEEDMEKFKTSLDCYITYKDLIQQSNIKNMIFNEVWFEFYQEQFNPPADDLFDRLNHS